jgi:2,4-dienoyl-CoA reductase-like NADH-dependent reductase (Old Yellow Enzyme family)
MVAQPMEANDGTSGGGVSERALERYRRLGRGRWGIVVVEALSVRESSLARKNQMVISRRNLDGFKRLVEVYRDADPDGVLLFQITHCGEKAGTFSTPQFLYSRDESTVVMSESEVEALRQDFVQASLLAAEAGADGVDFKMCHGYLGAEMIRPANTRGDRFGGSFENRSRFLLESIAELRSELGKGFILGSRVSYFEGIRGGCGTAGAEEIIEDLSEMNSLVRAMEKAGMDYVNVSAGIPGHTSEITRPTPGSLYLYLHQFRYAAQAKRMAGEKMGVIGSAYSILKEQALAAAQENITKGYTDFAGFGRQSFADPLTPLKIMEGRKVDWCTACSGCSKLMVRQVPDGCILYNDYYRNLYRSKAGG